MLNNKVAIITGAGGGIGRASSLHFAAQGATIVAVDLDQAAAEETTDLVRKAGGRGTAIGADVSRSADVEAFVQDALDQFGRVDVLFNAAGIEGPVAATVDHQVEEFDRVMAVNVRGTFLGMKHVLPLMVAQHSGAVINTGSACAVTGFSGLSAYTASKHAILGMTKVAAAEVGGTGVRVNALCPGPTNTRMMRDIEKAAMPDDPAAAIDAFAATIPMRRYGNPEEQAYVAAFLASDQASFVNGACWSADGGVTATREFFAPAAVEAGVPVNA